MLMDEDNHKDSKSTKDTKKRKKILNG